MSTNRFNKKNPPKSGTVRKLWEWWIRYKGGPPAAITLNRPTQVDYQRFGIPRYEIKDQRGILYFVWDVDKALAKSPDHGEWSDEKNGWWVA
jgi:hypothetical protein